MHAFVSMNPVRRRRLGGAVRTALVAVAFVPVFGAASDVRPEAASVAAVADATARARYTILLKGEPVATYRGGVPGFAPAARFASGRKVGRLDVKAAASQAYAAYLADRQRAFAQSLGTAIGRPLAPIATMQHALNAIIVELDPREAELARSRADVELVEREEIRALLTDRGPAFIGRRRSGTAAHRTASRRRARASSSPISTRASTGRAPRSPRRARATATSTRIRTAQASTSGSVA